MTAQTQSWKCRDWNYQLAMTDAVADNPRVKCMSRSPLCFLPRIAFAFADQTSFSSTHLCQSTIFVLLGHYQYRRQHLVVAGTVFV